MINKWHQILGMAKHNKSWYEQDLIEEIGEFKKEKSLLKKWSELSDVVYTCTRSRWNGYDISFPFSKWHFLLGSMYMIPKYSGRWLFFRRAGKKANSKRPLREVRNPQKTDKLYLVAQEYQIDSKVFKNICEKQLKYWFLLP